jgi:hypothetical protein
MDDNDIADNLKFPRSLDTRAWSNYLDRQLTWQEVYIIEDFKAERHMNEQLEILYDQCSKYNMFVPILTNLDGNCLFESLVYFGIAETIEILRNSMAYLMYIFKDYKNLLPGVEYSLKEMFDFTNDIEVVFSVFKNPETHEKHYNFYKYTYDTMCKDLTNLCSWSKLPTEIIMRLMSYLFNIEFVILHNNTGHFTNVNVYSELPVSNRPPMQKIFLGLIGESHYVPIDILKPKEEIDPMFYMEGKKKFIKWAKTKQDEKTMEYERRLKRLRDFNFDPNPLYVEPGSHKFSNLDLTSNEPTNLIDFTDQNDTNTNVLNDNPIHHSNNNPNESNPDDNNSSESSTFSTISSCSDSLPTFSDSSNDITTNEPNDPNDAIKT